MYSLTFGFAEMKLDTDLIRCEVFDKHVNNLLSVSVNKHLALISHSRGQQRAQLIKGMPDIFLKIKYMYPYIRKLSYK